jgi:multiple sugar transport system permease protein
MAVAGGHRGRRVAGWTTANIVVFVCALFPVFWLLMLSLKRPEDIGTDGGRLIPLHFSTDNYFGAKGVFHQSVFTDALRNSIGIALIATIIAVILASMTAYAIARLDFPGKRAILTMALVITIFPPIAIVGPLFDMWRVFGFFDTWIGLIIPYMTFTLPLAIYVLATFFREIPWELEQAAQVDGATPWQAFTKVIAPLAAPGVFTTAILVFIFAWNDFIFAVSLTATSSAQTVPAALFQFPGASQFQSPTGSIAAAAIVVTIPIVLMVLFFQRRIVAGLTAGAVKG